LCLSVVGKYEILNKFKKFVLNYVKNINPSVNKHKSIFGLSLGGRASRIIAKILYEDCQENERLTRKYVIYEKFKNKKMPKDRKEFN